MTEVQRRKKPGRREREKTFPTIPLRQRLRAGAEAGLALGAFFSCIAAVLALLNGGEVPNRYSGDGIPLPAVLFTYIVIGPVTGFFYGLLFPLLRVPLLAYLAGVLASVPFSLSVAVTVSGEPWSSGMVLFVGGCIAVTLGGFGGLIVRDVFLE